MDLSALIAACEEICESLDGTVKTDVLSVPTAKASPGGLHSKSTVSIVYNICFQEKIAIGRLFRGFVLVCVHVCAF